MQISLRHIAKQIFSPLRYGFAQITAPIGTSEYFIQLEEEYGCHNYAPLPVVAKKGEGVFLWDCEGKKYFDFVAGISSVNQGHAHPKLLKTLIQQASTLPQVSRSIYTDQLGQTQLYFKQIFGYDKSVLMSTGCEAGETAVKYARRWAYNVKGVPQNSAKIIFAKGNFWGRGIAACASSDDPLRFYKFGPFEGLGFQLVEYNNEQALEEVLQKDAKNVAAFMIEPIQGEKGVIIPHANYLRNVKKICEKYNVLLIIDEIQTGLGRTGKLLAHQWEEGFKPDMILLGKSLAGGLYPVSAVLANNEVMLQIKPGEHGSTWGGNPLASAMAAAGVRVLIEEGMIENSNKLGKFYLQELRSIFKKDFIKEVRGRGLYAGIEFRADQKVKASDYAFQLLMNGVIAKNNGNTMRLVPPLVITEKQLQQSLEIFKKCIDKL